MPAVFTPPVVLGNPPVGPEHRGVAYRLFRYLGPQPVGQSVVGLFATPNLLTSDQASFESAVPAHTLTNVVDPPVRTTAQAAHGSYSLAVTAIASAAAQVHYSAITISPSTTYYLMVSTRAATNARSCGFSFDVKNSGGSNVMQGGGHFPNSASAWSDVAFAITPPATAATLHLSLSITNPLAGEIFYFDKVGLFRASTATWVPPGGNYSDYTTVPTPDQLLLAGLRDGVDYFLGGHEYVVSDAVAAALAAAGYSPETQFLGPEAGDVLLAENGDTLILEGS